MKPLLLIALSIWVPPLPPAQIGSGWLTSREEAVIRVDRFKSKIGLRADVKGHGGADIDCYFSDGLGHMIGRDFTFTNGCTLFTSQEDKVWLMIVNDGLSSGSYEYRITQTQ